MAPLTVPIANPVYKSVDEIELNDEQSILYDGYVTETGGIRSRPGSQLMFNQDASTGLGVDGLWYWQDKDIVIAVLGGDISMYTYKQLVPLGIYNTGTGRVMLQNSPVTFATDGTYAFLANGGRIAYFSDTNFQGYIGDTDVPSYVSHVVYLDGYILCNQVGTNKFYWSNVNESTNWAALNFASATGNTDSIIAIHVLNREIYLFGSRTIEIWENDGTTPFSRIPGGMIECGCSAPYSVIIDENNIYWLDHKRRLVMYDGKNVQTIGTKYDKEIQGLMSVADCRAFKMDFDGTVFFVFQFPSADRTFVYNFSKKDWSEWGKWNSDEGRYAAWIGSCYQYVEPWGVHLIGRRDKQSLSRLSHSFVTDDGDTIRLSRKTGHISYGTLEPKRSNEFRMRAHRGDGISSGTPTVCIRYKIDNRDWSRLVPLSLGKLGEYNITLRDVRRNIFRTKQYEFVATDAVQLVFAGAEEDVEVLR